VARKGLDAPEPDQQVQSRAPFYEEWRSDVEKMDTSKPGREFNAQGEALWIPPFYEGFDNPVGVILEDLTFFIRFERHGSPPLIASVDFQPNGLPWNARGFFIAVPFSRVWIQRRVGAVTFKRFYTFRTRTVIPLP